MFHIILLERDALRVENVHRHILPHLPPPNHYTIFKAIDGKTQQIEQSIERFHITPQKQYYLKNYLFNFTRGQLGCLLSHLSLWHNLLSSNPPHLITLEDDCILGPTFSTHVNNILAELPSDYDFCYLYVFDDHYKNTDDVTIPGKQFINKAYYTWCTLSYIVSRAGAQKLIDNFKNIDLPLDEKIIILINNGTLNAFSAKHRFITNNGCKNSTDTSGLPSNIWSSPQF